MRIAVSRAPEAGRLVSPLELFFDLVYVFAVGQLSNHLVDHLDLRTGAETAILALAVYYAWYMTAWGANWLDPDRMPVRLLLLLAQLLFLRETLQRTPRSRLLGLAALLIGALATAPLSLIAGIAAASAVLVAVAIADTVGGRATSD
ncbi:MAG: low temperature requirement protein A [Solirubrobacterales bacterium]